ncbi:EAL domain-containing protein [Halomonas sp. LBP4]|uniref:EAL domain-containing protein n=1 Tax=Halomonas sp. LBP4 TaxID=2044917 RepID=UPI0021AC8268|nr:GGDEF domain-containing phosphodiesterase [Halomonas sp. LBP4]
MGRLTVSRWSGKRPACEGGDEFLVLLPEFDALDAVTRVARRRIEEVSEPFSMGGHEFRVGCMESGEGLEVHYQPLVERDSGEVHGAEALLRWSPPGFGAVSPREFIPLAERSGLIIPLGQRLMRLVAAQLRAWRESWACAWSPKGWRPKPSARHSLAIPSVCSRAT